MLSATLLLCSELVSSQEGGSPHVMSLLCESLFPPDPTDQSAKKKNSQRLLSVTLYSRSQTYGGLCGHCKERKEILLNSPQSPPRPY